MVVKAVAKQVIKKAIPKSKKGKVAVAGAAAAGVALSKDSKPKETPGAITPSVDAQNANAPQGAGDAKTTLIGLPVGTKIKAGTSGFPGIPYRLDYSGPTYTQADAVKGDAEKYLATKNASEKAALLLRLGQIPNLYSKGMAPNGTYVQSMGNRVIWRPEDAKALESILMVQDQLGDPTPDITLTNLISNQTLSSKFFGRVSGTAKAVTPLAQIEAELNDKFLDLFETKPDINLVKAYAKEVNALEASQSGISAQQKEDILLKYIQKKAKQLYSLDESGAGSTGGYTGIPASDKGALGRVVRSLRSAYEDNGIPVNEKRIYNDAVLSLRSADAYKNILDGITMQASVVMPAFKDFFAQGKTATEVLAPYRALKSRITGIPEEQIKVSDLYEIGAGTTPMSITDWKKSIYKSKEYRESDAFKQRSLGDLQSLLKAFNLG